jgi:hypothetical protein
MGLYRTSQQIVAVLVGRRGCLVLDRSRLGNPTTRRPGRWLEGGSTSALLPDGFFQNSWDIRAILLHYIG